MKAISIRKAFALFLTTATIFATASCASSPSGESASGEGAAQQSSGEEGPEEESTQEQSTRKNLLTGNSSAQALAESYGSFAEAHDAFTTTLAREENDSDAVPEPPEGLFDLVSFSSKVGDLAAYVSSDPGDGEKHPLIIWVVGGWGNGIDDFPWCYPAWDNDQTGSAFWQAGVLTMYPSFRGGNGNPGHYEALFGEVDDIVSAYDYAASLPYVDPDRIYLGGHSTGATRALLASEYTDKFRAVFCYGAVDEVKYHNNSQFTFDTENEDEFTMRSPIHWLDDVKSPTFLIEGRDGNSENLERMQQATDNENIHGFVIEGADHFSTLAPLTRLAAEKILADTGESCSISITQEELDAAMAKEPEVPVPVMTSRTIDSLGLTFSCPYLWMLDDSDAEELALYSRYEDDNAWDMSVLYIDTYSLADIPDLAGLGESLAAEAYETAQTTVAGLPALDAATTFQGDDGTIYYQHYAFIQTDSRYVNFSFVTFEDFKEESDLLFQSILDSVSFESAQ